MRKLEGKVAVITGGASGMGEAMAQLFLEHGARVVIADIDREKVKTVAATLSRGSPGNCVGVTADVAVSHDAEHMVQAAVDEFGRLDIMCNNAGYPPDALIHEMDEAMFDRVIAINQRGVWLGIKYAVIAMMRNGNPGSIITTASWTGQHAAIAHSAYGSAKAGAIYITQTAALEYAPYGIRANVISPSGIVTPMNYANPAYPIDKEVLEMAFRDLQPLRRAGMPIDVAEAALYFASDASRFVTGQILGVDGGGRMYYRPRMAELIAKAKEKYQSGAHE
jgi:NAD(P)-dependent dehydrogenase (short-subunit alcohol dehydrogenase family)